MSLQSRSVCLHVSAGIIYVQLSCVPVLPVKGLGGSFLRVTLCLVRWFPSSYCLCAIFGGCAVAGSPAPGAHECLFLTVGDISISDGMRGFGHREVEGLPVSCCMYVRVCGYR